MNTSNLGRRKTSLCGCLPHSCKSWPFYLKVRSRLLFYASLHLYYIPANTPCNKPFELCIALAMKSEDREAVISSYSRNGELRTQKLKSHLVGTQSLNVLPLKPGIGQYTAIMLRLLPGISTLLISTLRVHSPAFFQKPLPVFFLCWLWLTPVPV